MRTAIETHGEKLLFSVSDYHRLIELGFFTPDDHVELLNGEIHLMAAMGSLHASMVARLTEIFTGSCGKRANVSVQLPLALDERSEPEPDLMLLARKSDFYASGHPTPEEVLLLIEVADSSLDYDKDQKIPAYAAAGVQEVWLVDVAHCSLKIFREPDGVREYQQLHTVAKEESFAPKAFPEIMLTFPDLGWS